MTPCLVGTRRGGPSPGGPALAPAVSGTRLSLHEVRAHPSLLNGQTGMWATGAARPRRDGRWPVLGVRPCPSGAQGRVQAGRHAAALPSRLTGQPWGDDRVSGPRAPGCTVHETGRRPPPAGGALPGCCLVAPPSAHDRSGASEVQGASSGLAARLPVRHSPNVYSEWFSSNI